MYRNLILLLIFGIMCNSTDSLFIQDPKDVERGKYTDEGYFYIIRSTHALKKRDVVTVSVPNGVKPNDETMIIMPNSGMNYPYSNYAINPYSPYGANSGTKVIVSIPDGNYNSGYGTKYIPNRSG